MTARYVSNKDGKFQNPLFRRSAMNYTETDIPLSLHHGEMLTFEDGSELRWESNGEAKVVYVNDGFAPLTEIFPGNSYDFEAGGHFFRLSAKFEDDLVVERA